MQEAAAARLRGKRGKAKKAQAKYAHQDEEDKALALQLLDPAGDQFICSSLFYVLKLLRSCKVS